AIFGTNGQLVTYAFLFMLFITVFYPFFSEQRRRERTLKAGVKSLSN
ncbi:MAG: arginine/agmatine antiporter, partial [Rhodanobacter sp.]